MSKNGKKELSKVNRLILNGFYGSLSWVLPLILAFFSTPILIKGLGTENYGIYVLIIVFLGYTFNFSIGRAVTKYVSEYRAQNKIQEAIETVASTYYISIFLSVIANLLIFVFAEKIVRDVLQIDPERQNEAIYALYISGGTIAFLLISQIYQGLIQAAHRFDSLAYINNFNGILFAVGNVALIWLGYGILALVWWYLIITFLTCLLFYLTSRKLLPEIKTSLKFNLKSIGFLGKFGLGIFIYQIAGNIMMLFERGWITRRFGEESLTHYAVPMSLGIYLLGFTISFVQVVFPVISEMQNEREKIIRLYQKSTKVVLTLISFVVLSLICGSKLLLSLWISPEFAENSYQLLIFHALSFGTYAIYMISWQLAEGFGVPKLNAFISFIWLGLSIPGMIYFSYYWGENGVALARFLAIFASFPMIFYAEKRFLGNVQLSFWLKNILTLTTVILLSAFVENYIYQSFNPTWLTLIGGGFAGFAVFLTGLLILGFVTNDEKILLRNLIKR